MFLRSPSARSALNSCRFLAACFAGLWFAATVNAQNPRTSWTGADTGASANFNWSDLNNWTNGLPDITKEVWFDQNSRPVDNPTGGDMTINDLLPSGDYNHDGKVDAADYVLWRKDPASNGGDPAGYDTWRANFGVVGTAILGIVNTSGSGGTAGSGPTGNLSISGNPLSIGNIGIRFGGSAFTTPYNQGATKPLAINTDITLSADQVWQTGGTFGTINPNDSDSTKAKQSLTIGQSRDVHVNTVNTNGHTVTIKTIGSAHTVLVNSDVIGSGALGFDKGPAGSANAVSAVRILGTNTYSGNTNILGSRQIIQLGTSTVKNGQGQIISGPLGTGQISSTENPNCGTGVCNSQYAAYEPWGADRTLDNDIIMRGMFFVSRANDSSDTTTRHTLTLNGTITVPESSGFGGSAGSGPPNSSRILINSNGSPTAGNNTLGSGDVVVNGNVMLSNPAGTPGFDGQTGGTFGAGYGGATSASSPVSGKITFNGNIVKTAGAGTYSFHAEAWPTNAQLNPLRVRLNGQNTFDAAFIITKSADPSVTATITDANIQLGSSSILSGGNIVSGPLGTGLVTVGGLPLDNYGNPGVTTKAVQASMEAVGAARTLANNFSFINDAANSLTSGLLVQGSQNLTLSGAISSAGALGGGGGISKDGAATLTLSGANAYAGDTRVLGGTMAINFTSPTTPWLADSADVYLTSGSTLALNFPSAGATDTIRSLYIDNVLQAAGSWGAPGSGAAHTTSLISGIGWLGTTVGGSGSALGTVPEPACLTILMSAVGVMFISGRRR